MPRLDLPELEDQPWFPPRLRNLMTEFLYQHLDTFDIYKAVVPKLANALRDTRFALAPDAVADSPHEVLDLCSGGSGPWRRVLSHLERDHGVKARVTLSDLYPNARAFERIKRAAPDGQINVTKSPVDATAVPANLGGFRTLFTCIHHFPPALVGQIFQDAIHQRRGIAAFDLTERSVMATAIAALGTTTLPLLTPLIKPWRWDRFLLTNVVPVIPACFCWDSIISQLRGYTPAELLDITRSLPGADAYTWDAGQVPHQWLPMRLTYLIATPN